MVIDDLGLCQYRRSLDEIRLHLARFRVQHWPERLSNWLSELDAAVASGQNSTVVAHIARSQRATGGMGSMGDIFISPQAGDTIPDDDHTIALANKQLDQLIDALYQLTVTLLGRDVRQTQE